MAKAKSSGYLNLWRKSKDSAVFQDADLWHLWSYLLISAQYKRSQLPDGRWLEPGQCIIAVRTVAEDLRCGKSSIARRLKKLEKLGNIGTQSGTHGTIVTISNWATYNGKELKSGTQSGTQAGHERDTAGTQPGQCNKDNKENKDKKERESTLARSREEFMSVVFSDWRTPEFLAAWGAWFDWYFSVNGTPVHFHQAEQTIRLLHGRGDLAKAIEDIRFSIFRGAKRSIRDSSLDYERNGRESAEDRRSSDRKKIKAAMAAAAKENRQHFTLGSDQ